MIPSANQVLINDALIEYEVTYDQVKNPKLDLSSGKLVLILPEGFTDHMALIHKHKRWIYSRHTHMKNVLEVSKGIKLNKQRSDTELKVIVHDFIEKIGPELGVSFNKVSFKKMKTKWGSCSCRGNLNFNRYLRCLPGYLIEFVVFHEMAHLLEMKHSPKFWNIIESRYPDRSSYEKELNGYWYLIKESFFE